MRRKRARLLVALIASVAALAGEPTSFDFKGIALGSTLDQLAEPKRFLCFAKGRDALHDQHCILSPNETETIAGVSVNELELHYYDNKLWFILIRFDSDSFAQVLTALRAKYGGGVEAREMIRTKAGVQHENVTVVWKRSAATLTAKRFMKSVDESFVAIQSASGLREFSRRDKGEMKKEAEDL